MLFYDKEEEYKFRKKWEERMKQIDSMNMKYKKSEYMDNIMKNNKMRQEKDCKLFGDK